MSGICIAVSTFAMKLSSHMCQTAAAMGLLVLLSGCLSTPHLSTPAQLDNATFMTAWDIYRHCQTSTDVEAMRADMKQLVRAAAAQEAATSTSLPLPNFLRQKIAKPAQRLAADPNAMVASCALSTGQAALQAERMEMATEMFQSVLSSHTQPEYAFYAEQARIGLLEVERAVQFAGRLSDITPALIHISVIAPDPQNSAPVSFED